MARRRLFTAEGMVETLTLIRLGIDGQLAKTLGSTNPLREHDRDRPPHPAQREALARR